jgi:hypothetical protein
VGPVRHALLSAAVGAVLVPLTHDPRTFWAALAAGTLIDLDHALDYVLAHGLRLDFGAVRSGSYFARSGRVLVPFHSYELVLAAGLLVGWFAGWSLGVGVAAGALVHLAWDVGHYGLRPAAYSLAFRISHNFRASALKRPPRRREKVPATA